MLIHQLLAEAEQKNGPAPAYFHYARSASETERRDPEQIMRCIAKQLSYLYQSVLSPTREVYQKRLKSGDMRSQLVLNSTVELILKLTAIRPSPAIIIDALDECDIGDQIAVIDCLSQIYKHSTGTVKIFVSSRDDQALCYGLVDYSDLEISAAQNQGDITAFECHELEALITTKRLLYGQVPKEMRMRIVSVLCEKAQGM